MKSTYVSDLSIDLFYLYNQLKPSDQRIIRELIVKLQPRPYTSVLSSFYPLSAIPSWLDRLILEDKSSNTISYYLLAVNSLLHQFSIPSADDIDNHLLEAMRRGVSPQTINKKIYSFKSFYRYCLTHELTYVDPSSHLKSLKVPYRERVIPTIEDVLKLLLLITTPQDRAMLYLFVDAGLRLTELRFIRLIDIKPFEVTVIGKGNKQRTVPLSFAAQSAIDALVSTLPPDSIYLFSGRFKNLPIHWQTIEKHFRRLCIQACIPPIQPHQLRHFFTSQMLNQGANLKVVSQLLGHSSPAVTSNVYWHIDSGEKKAQHDKYSPLDSVLKEGLST